MTSELSLSPEDVNDILAILDGTAYSHIDIGTTRFRLRVAREGKGWTQSWDWAANDAAAPQERPAAAPAMPPEAAVPEGLVAVRAPLPGTFYRAPQPGAAPFVQPGDAVEPDTTLGIIETMKLMNQVAAGCRGTIEAIQAVNGSMVDAQALLILIRPA